MNKSSLPIIYGISVLVFCSVMLQIMQISCFAKEIAEPIDDVSGQMEVGNYLVVSLRKQDPNEGEVIFEASNSSSHPVSMKCNIPSL